VTRRNSREHVTTISGALGVDTADTVFDDGFDGVAVPESTGRRSVGRFAVAFHAYSVVAATWMDIASMLIEQRRMDMLKLRRTMLHGFDAARILDEAAAFRAQREMLVACLWSQWTRGEPRSIQPVFVCRHHR
jgi:hypothetical protein